MNGATARAPRSCALAAETCSASYPSSLSGAKRMTVEYLGGPSHLVDTRTVDDPA